jgi:hypothetical protein
MYIRRRNLDASNVLFDDFWIIAETFDKDCWYAMSIKCLFPLSSHQACGIDCVVDSYLAILFVKKVEEVGAALVQDLFTKG